MKVSYNWLNKYFDGKLPGAEAVAEALTFHAWEIEEVAPAGDDTVLDVKVLPDKSMWALSHRGIAKDLSVILDLPLTRDPLTEPAAIEAPGDDLKIDLRSETGRRFAAARIDGVAVAPSPAWLREALEAIGQRSINNIVDASNYVMFDLGQPSHAFDAALIGEQGFRVRPARAGETLIGLDEKEYAFTADDTVIARGDTDEILSIAGLKGGRHSGISPSTRDVIVEAANWDPVAVRKTGQRLKLRTDASARYENGIVPEMVPYGLRAVVELILKVAGGTLAGSADTGAGAASDRPAVAVSLPQINSVLGARLSGEKVAGIFDRFGWRYEAAGEEFRIRPPFERADLMIAEDIIEEVGRVYGYEHVAAVIPPPAPLRQINQRFYYAELARAALLARGFSEIYTSSFRERDQVKLANAFAADKGYLRSSLRDNMKEALARNAPNADLLGVRQIRLFEIGTVFHQEGERWMLAMGAESSSGYKAKADDPAIAEALAALAAALGAPIEAEAKQGIAEFDFGAAVASLPVPAAYQAAGAVPRVSYQPFSPYPAVARDIAIWVPAGAEAEEIADLLRAAAGPLLVRLTLFDTFEKDGRASLAFRLVFQSKEKTLTDAEANAVMDGIYRAISERGLEVR